MRLAQQPLRSRPGAPPNGSTWKVPVCVAYGTPRAEACFLLDGPSREEPLAGACPSWLVANAHENGYFRAVPPRGKALAAALLALEPLERAGLVSSISAEVHAGEAHVDELVSVLRMLRGEKDRAPLLAMVAALSMLHEQVAADEDVAAVAKLARDVLGPSLAGLGWSPDAEERSTCPRCSAGASDEATSTRELLLGALAHLGDDRGVLAAAKKRADLVLSGSPSVSTENAAIALRLAAMKGDEALLEALAKRARTAATPADRLSALTALSDLEVPALVRRVLDLSLTDAIKIQDLRYVYGPAFESRASQATVFAWLEQSWDAVHRRVPPWLLPRFVALVGSACTPAERDRRKAFLAPRTADVEGADRELVLALAHADACIDLRAREAERLRKTLARLYGGRCAGSARSRDAARVRRTGRMPHEPLVQRAVRSFDGTELAAYASPMPRAGAGTILLIGPPGAGAVAWRHQSHYFAPRYRIVTWDWRGLGSSRRPSDPSALDVADQARDAAAVLADAGAPHAAMLAWGEGAQVALDIAHRAPTIPSHLVLICPRWGATFGRKLGMPTAGWVAPLTRALEPAARRLARWPEAAAWTIRLGLAAQALDAELFAEIAARGAELDPETLAATSRGLSRHVDAPMPESITMPTLMVAGTRDRVTPPELARRLARRLPFGELFVVEDASGWAPLEYPELINLRIEKFLDQTGFA